MTHWIDLANFAIAVSGLTVALLGLFLSLLTRFHSGRLQTHFIVLFSIITAYISANLISQISLAFFGPDYTLLSKAAIFFESLFSAMLMPMLTILLLYTANLTQKNSRILLCSAILFVIYLALLIYTQFSTSIYFFTDDNIYHRGPAYPLLLIPPVLLMLYNLFMLYRLRSEMTAQNLLALLIYLVIPLICMLIQMAFYGLMIIVLGISVGALIMFIMLVQEQAHHIERTEIKNTRQAASILVLEMRPHFIYNTMTSIYYLTSQNPVKAQAVIQDFITYLRKNFDAISKSDLIPFPEELSHVKAYLSIEQVRFEDMLSVEYDVSHRDFFLPPLTLQPIVENAVRYGVDTEGDPLRILIRTEKSGMHSLITVEDSGPGYAPEDTETHNALHNISERLRLMCRGRLTIAPGEEGGTVVTIRI